MSEQQWIKMNERKQCVTNSYIVGYFGGLKENGPHGFIYL